MARMGGDELVIRDAAELSEMPAGEVALLVDGDGVLVAGGVRDVAAWVDRLRGHVGGAAQASGLSTSRIADGAAVGTAVASAVMLSNDYVRLTPASLELIRDNGLIPGADGAYRMFVRGEGGQIAGQLQFTKVRFGPELAMGMQAYAATAALRAAIASVEDAVARVDGKVDKLLVLAAAERTGDILGNHQVLAHLVDLVDARGMLPAADWDSVASLGPALVAGTEKLRAHVTGTLEALDASLPAQDRADKLKNAVKDGRVGDTLQLLLVAQDSLYLWQRLRIARVQASEPEHLDAVIESARGQLREYLRLDQELVQLTASRLASYASLKPLELHRKLSARSLQSNLSSLQKDLTGFATQRHLQIVGWEGGAAPTVRDALSEVRNRAVHGGRAVRALGSKAVDSSAQGAGQAGHWLQGIERRRSWAKAERADRRTDPADE